MKITRCVCVFAIILMIAGCGSAERKANKSIAKVNDERLSLIEDYEKCIKKAGEDEAKSEACDSYLKAADALR